MWRLDLPRIDEQRRKGEAVSEPGDAIRVSDAERDVTLRVLSEQASVGRLTLDELEERSAKALAAKTRGDLATLTSDLPAPDVAQPQAGVPAATPRRPVRWIVALLGGGHHGGRFRAVGSINAVALLGGAEIDLRNAEIEGGELTVNTFALLGGPNIYIPDTVEVETGGLSILGGVQKQGSLRSPRPGAPVIKIRAFALLGGASVYRLSAEARGLSARQIRMAAMREHLGAVGRGRGGFGAVGDGSDDEPSGFGCGPGGFRGRGRGRGRFGDGRGL